ncbi:MAG: serine hydrolase, partial [Clostridia bacterium]|nr:serine hydrolase [Clostridia bacterium]
MNLSAVNRSVLLLSRLFDPSRTIQPFLPMTMGKPVFQTQHPRFFPRVTAEEEGVSSAQLAALLQTLRDHPQLRMHTVTVLRHGRVICEANFGAYDAAMPQYTYSACKSIVSLATGILCGTGALSTDDKLIDLFPDRVSAVTRLRLANLRVEDLLTMRSGIIFNELESQTDEDWIKCFLNSAVTAEPGQDFAYNSLNTYMLAAILVRKTGKTLTAFLKEQLFDALDIRDFFWETCPRGIEKGGWGLYLRSEDLAKLGMLILRGGVWNGTRLIP